MQQGKKKMKVHLGNDRSETADLKGNESSEQVTDSGRRQVIKRSMQLAAAAYVAPVTLQLLTATRATAQSLPDEACCSAVDVTNEEGSTDPIHMHYTQCGAAFPTLLNVAAGDTVPISVEPGTDILIHIQGYLGTSTITGNSGSVGNVTGSGTSGASVTVTSCGVGTVSALLINN